MGGRSQAPRICAAAIGSWLLGATALATITSGQSSFFPAQSTVLLITGLPGDLESENTYRDQLKTWLEIVQASDAVATVFVLSDSPELLPTPIEAGAVSNQPEPNSTVQTQGTREQSPSPKSRLSVTWLHADQTNFLGLRSRLAQSTNALTVIAWGHGGRQGSTPVFHVRGPRITATDFKTLASGAAAAASRWILMFPGSGLVASQLAGDQRSVLSSECETMFNSDPVGMSLLLKLVRSRAPGSFEALAQEFGRATAAWYADRSLARTEEPTLWLGTEKPRRLAAGSETNSFGSINPGESTPTPPKKGLEPEAAGAELPGVWREIKRVEAQQYPEADAVRLRRRCAYTLGSSPAITTEQEEFVQILTLEGKRYGDFDISFSPPHEDISFLDCEVLRPDGKLVRLDPDAIREASEGPVEDYPAGRRKFFSLPGLVPGAVIHVRYRTVWQTFPLPHVSLEVPLDQELPAVATTIDVSVPKGTPFHFVADQVMAADPLIQQTGYGTTYGWQFNNLPAREGEILASPYERARLLISTFPDWLAFAEWYARISQLTDEVTPEISAKAKELTRSASSSREKVSAVYDYVTRLRYVAVPLGVNSFRPHGAAKVLQNQFGDCKDKANLLNALLHALGMQADLVLVPRFSQAHEEIPGLSFNHAISRVSVDGETLWADTTDDVCRFGMLPPGDPGRKVLVIDGRSRGLTQLPPPDPGEHQLTLRGEVDGAGTAEAMPMSLSATGLGYPDYELRETARQAKAHGFSFPLLAAKLRPVAGTFALQRQKASPVSALDEGFTWKAEGTWVGGSGSANGARWLSSPFWVPKEWDLALHHRKGGVFLNQGYPLRMVQDFQIALPADANPGSLPGVSENTAEPLRWKIEWTQSGRNQVMAKLRLELTRGDISAADTPLLQQQLRRLLGALAVSASWAGQR